MPVVFAWLSDTHRLDWVDVLNMTIAYLAHDWR